MSRLRDRSVLKTVLTLSDSSTRTRLCHLGPTSQTYWDPLIKLNRDNPPRRDVALLPANGYVVLAFKSDNPGSWLLHCHVMWNASSGLTLQILERQPEIKVFDVSMKAIDDGCKIWGKWYVDKNHWYGLKEVQDDSGISEVNDVP